MKTKLQLAFDDLTMDEALKLVEKTQEFIDIIEVGTPFMMEYGMNAVRTFKKHFPNKELLCDTKIMDAGAFEAAMPFKAGADYVTVLGVTDDRTIQDVLNTAKEYDGRKVMVDMICVENLEKRISRIEELGADLIAVHTGVDQQALGRTPLDDLREMRALVKQADLAVAGGIGPETLEPYMQYGPAIVIVGGGIAHAKDPVAAAATLREKIITLS